MLVFYYCIGKKKQHILASLRKAEQNIFVPSGLATGVFEELPKVCPNKKCNLRNYKDDDHLRSSYVEQNAAWIDQVFN